MHVSRIGYSGSIFLKLFNLCTAPGTASPTASCQTRTQTWSHSRCALGRTWSGSGQCLPCTAPLHRVLVDAQGPPSSGPFCSRRGGHHPAPSLQVLEPLASVWWQAWASKSQPTQPIWPCQVVANGVAARGVGLGDQRRRLAGFDVRRSSSRAKEQGRRARVLEKADYCCR